MVGEPGPRLQDHAIAAWRAGLAAVDAEHCTRDALASRDKVEWRSPSLVVAIGKAAAGMARGIGPVARGFAIVPTGVPSGELPAGFELLYGGHPVPTREGLNASRRVLSEVSKLGERDRLLVLLSGGASSLFEVPRPELADEDVISAYRLLLTSGLPIQDVNALRAVLSQTKAGGLAAHAVPAKVLTLAISDVPGDDVAAIGSGPTVAVPEVGTRARAALARWHECPAPLRRLFEHSFPQATFAARRLNTDGVRVIARASDARKAAEAELTRRGFTLAQGAPKSLEGTVEDAASRVVAMIRRRLTKPRMAVGWASAGETTVAVPPEHGIGGRNHHLAAAIAVALDGCGPFACISAGTDGIDGNSTCAGAVVDGQTAARARSTDVDLRDALARFDTATALQACGASFCPGATGANVGDLLVAVVGLPR